MDGCGLIASGREFEVDRFLAETGFSAIRIWRRGELTMKASKQDSGFHMTFFQAPRADGKVLVAKVRDFVTANSSHLQLLHTYGATEIQFSICAERELTKMPKYSGDFSDLTEYLEVYDQFTVSFPLAPDLMGFLSAIKATLSVIVGSPEME